jgi:serine/threonine-protein kinase RsbW
MEEFSPEHPSQSITLPGRFEYLPQIGEFVTRAAKAAGLTTAAIDAVEMAVDEAFTNIIEHAYGYEGRGDIQCSCHISEDGLTVILNDYGRPFDPESVPEPNIHARLEQRKEGGLGLYLIRQLMDEVRFEFDPETGNSLTLVKCKERAS